MNSMSLMLIAMILAMFVMTSFSMKKQKKNMEDVRAWRENLKEGDEVATHSGLLGKVVSIDIPHEEVIIDSQGSMSKWRLAAITEPPVRPLYADEQDSKEEQDNNDEQYSEKTKQNAEQENARSDSDSKTAKESEEKNSEDL